MRLIKSNFNKRFTLRDKEGKLFTQEFIKGDEYLENEMTPKNFELLSNYKYMGVYAFELFDVDVKNKEVKKEEIIEKVKKVEEKVEETETIQEDIKTQYETKFGKEVPRNKLNDTEWIMSKLSEV